MTKPILISGVQPTGKLHLGNYLGALKNFVDLQNSGKYRCYFFVADYHSLTEDFDPKEKSEQITNLAADYLAAGLDPQKSIIFLQSQVPQSAELAWILSAIAPFGEVNRMTQFKEKSEAQKENVNVGLFTYPILMAADILIFDAESVPVGEDQLQHLELTRTIARKFNKKFGKTFIEPQPILSKAPRLMSLDDPTKKMSKSHPAGCLFIDDSPKEIEAKIRSAVTDSGSEIKYDPKNKAGISNLITIYAELAESQVIASDSEAISKKIRLIEKKFAGKGYADFKKSLTEVVAGYFAPFRNKKAALLGLSLRGSASDCGNLSRIVIASKAKQSHQKLVKILNSGSKKAHEIAKKKMLEVKKKIGLIV